MKIIVKKIKIVVLSLILKDALTLKKKNSGDEFLVEKKNPLVMPPEYGMLPMPESINEDKKESNNSSIKNLIIKGEKNNKDLSVNNNNGTQTTSIEKLILEKIK